MVSRGRHPSTAQSGPWKIAWCHTGDSGGSKRAAFEMVRELTRRGHVIDEYIIRIGEPNLSHWPLQPFVRDSYRYLMPAVGNSLRPHLIHAWVQLCQDFLKMKSFMHTLKGVAADIHVRAYDFVHIDHCSPSYTVLLTTMLKSPTVVYSHEVSGARYEPSAFGGSRSTPARIRWAYEMGCGLAARTWSKFRQHQDLQGLADADIVLTNSCYSKEIMFQRARRLCSVCRYGVDTKSFRPLGMPVESMIVSAGRLVEAKQHHLVIEALSIVPESHRPRLVIATPETLTHQEDPAYVARLIRMAEAAHVALEITRNPSEGELVAIYNKALMLVFVPIMEPFGLVALEAMACGVPVVGVREAGVRESVLHDKSGILVDRDATELACAITFLIEHPETRGRQGREAADYVRKEWTWEQSLDCYECQVAVLLEQRVASSNGRTGKSDVRSIQAR